MPTGGLISAEWALRLTIVGVGLDPVSEGCGACRIAAVPSAARFHVAPMLLVFCFAAMSGARVMSLSFSLPTLIDVRGHSRAA